MERGAGVPVLFLHGGTGTGEFDWGAVADHLSRRGYRTIVCLAEPENESVLPTVRRAGLDGVATVADGLLEIVVPLPVRPRGLLRPA